jgi:hypothetical protein
MDIQAIEKTGPNYSVEKLLSARRKTTEAVLRIAEEIKPGMLEGCSSNWSVGIRRWSDSDAYQEDTYPFLKHELTAQRHSAHCTAAGDRNLPWGATNSPSSWGTHVSGTAQGTWPVPGYPD